MASVAANTTPVIGSSNSKSATSIAEKASTFQSFSDNSEVPFRPAFNRAFTTDSPSSLVKQESPDIAPDEIDVLQQRSRSQTLVSNGSIGSNGSAINGNSKISSSFKKLFIKPSKRYSNDSDSLTVIDNNEYLYPCFTNGNINGNASSALNSPESSFRSSFNNGSALSTTTSIDTFDDSSQIKGIGIISRNSSTGFSVEKEELDDLVTSNDDLFEDFDDELAYNNFLKKCTQKTNDAKLKSKKSVFNFKRVQPQYEQANSSSEANESNDAPQSKKENEVKGLRTIMNVKRQQMENHRLKKIKSVPTLRMPLNSNSQSLAVNKNEIRLPISPPAYQTTFRRSGGGLGNINSSSPMAHHNSSRPSSSSLASDALASTGNATAANFYIPSQRNSSSSSHQSYITSFSRNSVSSQASQDSLVSQVSHNQTPSLLNKK